MNSFNLTNILRPNIQKLVPYSSARSEFEGKASVYLDANENSMGSVLGQQYNRYPDPLQKILKQGISKLKGVAAQNIFIGNGSDEPIDLLIRACCEPGKDNMLIFPPTYGMYEVAANINNVVVKSVLLMEDFQLNTDAALKAIDKNTKLVFVCSPNNPSGNMMIEKDVEALLKNFNGLVVLDEAYIDFAENRSWLKSLSKYPNLVILQTFSKAWGMAALRIGMAFASVEIIDVLNKIKAPYNINHATQEMALHALTKEELVKEYVATILKERDALINALKKYVFIKKIFPSDSNFVLLRVDNADKLYNYLVSRGIVVRNRSKVPMCENCLRITVGTPDENVILQSALNTYQS